MQNGTNVFKLHLFGKAWKIKIGRFDLQKLWTDLRESRYLAKGKLDWYSKIHGCWQQFIKSF